MSPPPNGPSPNGKAAADLNKSPSRLPQARRWGKGLKLLVLAGVLVAVGSSGGGAWLYFTGLQTGRPDLLTHTVRREKLQLTIVERGALESAENSDITCRVKAGSKGSTVATTIKSVIEDGTHVTKGQLLVELDDSGLQEQLKSERITVDSARSAWIQAEENYKIQQSQNESEIKTAEIAVKLAELDLEKYVKGDYEQLKKDILGRIKTAESDLEQYRDRAAWSARMVQKGYQTASQAQADQSRLQSGELALAKVREEERVLDQYTYKRTVTDLESKVAETKRALDRAVQQAKSKEIQVDTERKSKKSIYEQELARQQDLEEEIKKCTIASPQDGMVVYYVSEQSRYGSGSQQSIVAQGEPVREGQKLMRIPDLKKMLVNTRVHEALVSRVRGEVWHPTGYCDSLRSALMTSPDALARMVGQWAFADLREKYRDKEQELDYGGQQASVRIDAFPDRVLHAHVKSVATVASQQDWMSADVKVYQTMVAIDESIDGLKPGMSAEVTIAVDGTPEEVLTVPVQAILGTPVMGKQRKCFVLTPQGIPEERDVVVGLSNTKMAEIKSGLQEGDEVVLNPRALLNERSKLKPAAGDKTAPDAAGSPEDKAGGKGGRSRGKDGEKGGGWPTGPGGKGEGWSKGPGDQPGGGPPGGSEEARKRQQEGMERFRKASPEERKQLLQQVPEDFRERVKQGLKAQGLPVAD